MDFLLKILAQYPALIVVIGILIILVLIAMFVAFLQGREISLGALKIGARPNSSDEQTAKRISPKSIQENSKVPNNHPKTVWPSPDLSARSLLRGAKDNLLLLGTSLSRAMHDDLFLYHEWLEGNPQRKLGLLFLNPGSPHAGGRSRLSVTRSDPTAIINALQIAFTEHQQHNRLIPAIYEGPYRYSARASDLNQRNGSGESNIDIVTSSHTKGTSQGFYISLSSKTTPEAHSFYATDLLQTWMAALANPPGHGISMLYRFNTQPDPAVIRTAADEFMKGLGRDKYALHAFDPKQYHLTLSSLCRTQSQPFLSPLRIGHSAADEHLPRHYGTFLHEIIQVASRISQGNISLVFDQITLDETGQVRLDLKKNSQDDLIRLATDIRKKQTNLINRYISQYQTEAWTSNRFLPRYDTFLPHITIGVAFDQTDGLPLKLKGKNYAMGLTNPLEFVCSNLVVVHYAYRSLLRWVGEFPIPAADDGRLSIETILRDLCIAPGM